MKTTTKVHVKKIVFVGILAAMSFVLFLFPKFPIMAAFPWLDLDLSDIPALFGATALSPLAGLAIVLVKNTIHLAITSTGMVGELSNFLINGSFVLFTGIFYRLLVKHKHNFTAAAFGSILGAIIQVIVAVLVNYFLMIPMYSAFVNFEELGGASAYILAGVVPFNIIKDVLAVLVFLLLFRLLYRKLSAFVNR